MTVDASRYRPARVRERRFKRLLPALLVVAVGLMLGPEAVRAALWLTFDPPSGTPGTTISVRTGGNGALGVANAGDAFPIYFVRDETPGKLLKVGIVTADRNHNAAGQFVVPDVASGRYGVTLRCEPCAEFSAGRSMLPVGEFTVLSGVPNTATLDVKGRQPADTRILAIAAAFAGMTGALLLRRRRRLS